MHRVYIGDMSAYNFWGSFGYCAMIFSTLFYYKSKCNAMGLFSRKIILIASKKNKILSKVVEAFLFALESFLVVCVIDLAIGNFNRSFGDFIGTGANYFGMLLTVMFFLLILSMILLVNPLKLMDISTMYLPVNLFFAKIGCYCAGCCYGISWEYGPYNHHPDHPGNQVPVQLIEAFWMILIFLFLLWYRKKAKPGSLFPIYMILYSATRFLSEFFRHEENVLGPFKMYHILCMVTIAYALFHLFFLHFYRDTINDLFDNIHGKVDAQVEAQKKEESARLIAEKEREEADRIARAEKAKQNRAKAKARKK